MAMTTLRTTKEQNHGTIATFPRFSGAVRNWLRQFTAVNELEQLSDRQLRDIGIERQDIERVAKRELARIRATDPITKR
jgi:uncharacterized protein YjiS (DUF1127 family)